MNKLGSILSLAGLATMAKGNVDCDWGAWSGLYPVAAGQCNTVTFENTGFSSFDFECATDSTGTFNYYDSSDCSGSFLYAENSTSVECGTGCEYDYGVLLDIDGYEDSTDCSGGSDGTASLYLVEVEDACLNLTTFSFEVTVNSTALNVDVYLSDDCTGSVVTQLGFSNGACEASDGNSTMFTFDQWLSTTVVFPSTTESGDDDDDDDDDETTTTEAAMMGTIGPFDCNLALYGGAWPFVANECSYISDGSGDESYMVECADDGYSAMIYRYDNTDCSGSAVNATNATWFYCGASGDCDTLEMTGKLTNYTSDCSGDPEETVEFILAELDDECLDLSWYYLNVDTSTDGVYLSAWSGSDCDGTKYFGQSLDAGCTEVNGTEGSVDISFEESTGSSGSGGSDGAIQMSTINCFSMVFVLFCLLFLK